jgi:hypothetical protein
MDKEQTAVEWFAEQLIKQGYFDKDIPFTQSTFDKLKEQAIIMETHLNHKAFCDGIVNGVS